MTEHPFQTGRFGGSPRTVIDRVSTSIGGITVQRKAGAHQACSSAPENQSSCEQQSQQPFLFGDASLTTPSPSRTVSIARCSATKAPTSHQSLSDRLTPSLIMSGLVCGITPTSTRQASGQAIQVFAFSPLAGENAASHKAGNLFSNDYEAAL